MARLSLLIFILLYSASGAWAQRNADAYANEGDRYFQQMAYARAVRSYTIAAELGARNEHVTKRLGESYMKLGDPEAAVQWYGELVKFMNVQPRDMLMYAEALKGCSRYEEAEEWMDKYLAATSTANTPPRSNVMGFARKLTEGEPRFTVRPTDINGPYSDFGASWLGTDRVLFVSSRNGTVAIERRAAWNDQPFLNIFTAELTLDGGLVEARILEGSVNSVMHEGPASASAGGTEIWFTRNGPPSRGNAPGVRSVARLGIHNASQVGNGFGNEAPFAFNDPSVSVAHPALSPDGRSLYFASDMPGGYGGMDLYVSQFMNGEWGEPRNLGPMINTERNEVFPYKGHDGTLYFASNGHPGLGGLDVYASKPEGNGYSAPINVGAPVNGPRDDFAFIIDPSNKRGYFSSNRPGGQGDDDIYAFVMLKPLEQDFLCNGIVYDDEYGTPVIGAEVFLQDLKGNVLATTSSGARGDYSFVVEKEKAYRIVARLRGRFDGEQHLSTERIEEEQIMARDIHLVADAGVWLRGAVRHKDMLGFIPGVTVSVVNTSTYQSESRKTGPGGDVNIRLQTNEDFEVLFERNGYFSFSVPVSTMGMRQGIIDLSVGRELVMEPIELGEPIKLKHIRWINDGKALDPISRTELDLLVELLMVNPDVFIEIAVHNDTRHISEAQQALSRTRAEVMAQYITGKGIGKDRVKHKGYGITQPLNHCVPGVQCSDEEHAANARITWTVTAVRE